MTSPAAQALRNDSADAAIAAHEVEARAVKELSAAASILKSAEPEASPPSSMRSIGAHRPKI